MTNETDFDLRCEAFKTNARIAGAFQMGRLLYEFGPGLDELMKVLKTEKWKRRRNLYYYLKLYRIYENLPAEEMDRLSDAKAAALVRGLLLDSYIRSNTPITDEMLTAPRREALNLALSEISPRNLQTTLRNGERLVPAFRKESEIEAWFKSYRGDFAREWSLEYQGGPLYVWLGRVVPSVDHVFCSGDALQRKLVLLELKDAVTFGDIGQVLAQRNGALEQWGGGQDGELRSVRLFRPQGKKAPLSIKVHDVEAWIVGQVFADSVYFAAKGQSIRLFEITRDKQIKEKIPSQPRGAPVTPGGSPS